LVLTTAIANDTWLEKPLRTITKVHLGPDFSEVVDRLCLLEASYGWINKTRGFPKVAVDRPAQLSMWVRDGRRRSTSPVVMDIPCFETAWWAWWLSLQPDWHPTQRPLEKGLYRDDWTKLKALGANGMLGVVACLYWWGKAVQGFEDVGVIKRAGNSNGWTEATEDVTWVLKGLLAHAKSDT
jgi:hypothetical protein